MVRFQVHELAQGNKSILDPNRVGTTTTGDAALAIQA
jgi:hypothetical protein